jgi:hypothetical protein
MIAEENILENSQDLKAPRRETNVHTVQRLCSVSPSK